MKLLTIGVILAITLATALASNSASSPASSPSLSSSSSSSTQSESGKSSNSGDAFDERKLRYEQDKKEVSGFLNTKNILRTVVKLLFGTTEESTATSRQVLNVLVKVLDMLRTSFGQRARSSTARGITDAFDDAAVAGVSMLKGYVKSILAKDAPCSQKFICEASKDAVREGRELGYLVAQFGGYASSYLLESQKSSPFNSSYEAARRGRSGEDCAKVYSTCNEADS